MNIEQKAITLIKEIEKRHHTPSQVMGSASFEQELMEEKIELVKKFLIEMKQEYRNDSGEACIVIAKILQGKQFYKITENELSIADMYLKRKEEQDRANYIRNLLDENSKLRHANKQN